jgi:hypothetical protein
MTEVAVDERKHAVERMHTCNAVLVQSVPVKERHGEDRDPKDFRPVRQHGLPDQVR